MRKLGVDARGAVDAAVSAVDLDDPLDQLGVLQGPRARDVRGPFVVAGAADAEQPAGHGDRGSGLLRRDQPVGGHRRSFSAAKKAAARLSRSRSCFRRAFSRRSARSSSSSALRRHVGALAGDQPRLVGASCAASARTPRGSWRARAGCGRHAASAPPRGGTPAGTRVGSWARWTPSLRAQRARVVRCPENRGNSTTRRSTRLRTLAAVSAPAGRSCARTGVARASVNSEQCLRHRRRRATPRETTGPATPVRPSPVPREIREFRKLVALHCCRP